MASEPGNSEASAEYRTPSTPMSSEQKLAAETPQPSSSSYDAMSKDIGELLCRFRALSDHLGVPPPDRYMKHGLDPREIDITPMEAIRTKDFKYDENVTVNYLLAQVPTEAMCLSPLWKSMFGLVPPPLGRQLLPAEQPPSVEGLQRLYEWSYLSPETAELTEYGFDANATSPVGQSRLGMGSDSEKTHFVCQFHTRFLVATLGLSGTKPKHTAQLTRHYGELISPSTKKLLSFAEKRISVAIRTTRHLDFPIYSLVTVSDHHCRYPDRNKASPHHSWIELGASPSPAINIFLLRAFEVFGETLHNWNVLVSEVDSSLDVDIMSILSREKRISIMESRASKYPHFARASSYFSDRCDLLDARIDEEQKKIQRLRNTFFTSTAVNEATKSKQLNHCILVFTVVTVIYLPLSFVSTLFALDAFDWNNPGQKEFFTVTAILVAIATYVFSGYLIWAVRRPAHIAWWKRLPVLSVNTVRRMLGRPVRDDEENV
ncbi:hypothetical protein QBC43DRAFT_355537 [Cladorrhinum sp. PSN259]|nr:hypothetical protein QBC43DRAFT_355537 [Cladorrhinum sp. PSN259]